MALGSLEVLLGVIGVFFLYLALISVQRLFLSPLAKYPGPRLAALSNWYEFYYDVVSQGQFTKHIQYLHRVYG